MKITRRQLRRLINEEIEVFNIRNKGQFAYVMQNIMDNPDQQINNDLIEPIKGKIILSKGQTFNDITPNASYILMKYYNIESNPSANLRKPLSRTPSREIDQQRRQSQALHTGPDDVDSVASSLMSHVMGGSPPLRGSINKIVADAKRGEIAVYLQAPDKRSATDQQVACALRFLLDNKINPASKYIINPCGYKDRKHSDLMMIVKL